MMYCHYRTLMVAEIQKILNTKNAILLNYLFAQDNDEHKSIVSRLLIVNINNRRINKHKYIC